MADGLNDLFGRMNLGIGQGGRPRHLPPTTEGLMLIPPVPYDIPEESRRGVNCEVILPSGVAEDMIRVSIIHGGWSAQIRLDWPEFFAKEDRVHNQDGVAVGNSQANAMQQGVRLLRRIQIENIQTFWIIALPIQVEQRISPNQVQVLATPNVKQLGQYILYAKFTLKTEPLGYMSAASPAGIRFVNVSGGTQQQGFRQPNFGPSNFGNFQPQQAQQPMQQPAQQPQAQQQPQPPPPPQPQPQAQQQPQPQPQAQQQQQHVQPPVQPQFQPSQANFNDQQAIERWLRGQSDTELQTNLDNIFAFAQQNARNFSNEETAQMNWLIQQFHDEMQGRMQSPNGWNP